MPSGLYRYGVVIDVLKVLHLPDNHHTAVVRARDKFRIIGRGAGETIPAANLSARVKLVRDTSPRADDKEFMALSAAVRETTSSILKKMGNDVGDMAMNIANYPDPVGLINMVATHAPIETAVKEELLAYHRIKERAFALLTQLTRNEQMVDITREIQQRARQSIGEQQRNHFRSSRWRRYARSFTATPGRGCRVAPRRPTRPIFPRRSKRLSARNSTSCAGSISRVPNGPCRCRISKLCSICRGIRCRL